MIIAKNKTNGNSDIIELKKRVEEAEEAEKSREMQTFQKTVDDLTESIEDFTGKFQELIDLQVAESKKEKPIAEYFDKDLKSSIDKAVGVLQKLKQTAPEINIDISPLANEIKKSNDKIIELLNRPNQSDEVVRMLSAMVGKQNITFEKFANQVDYSPKFDLLIQAMNNNKSNSEKVQELEVQYKNGAISKVIPIYKNQ